MEKFYKCQLACVDISCRGKLGEVIGEFIVKQNHNGNVYHEAKTGHMFRTFDYDTKLTDSTGLYSYPNIFVCQGSLQEISYEEASKELKKEEYGSKGKVEMKLCRAAISNGFVPRNGVFWADIVHIKPSYYDSLDSKDLDNFGRYIVIDMCDGCYTEILTGQKFGYFFNTCRATGLKYPCTENYKAYLYTGNPFMVVDKNRADCINDKNLRDEIKGYVAVLDEKELDENFKKTQEILERAATPGESMQDYTGLPLDYGFRGSLTKRQKSNKE
jgi:hypothetical protein